MIGKLHILDKQSPVAEWYRAPTHSPREGGGAGSDPSLEYIRFRTFFFTLCNPEKKELYIFDEMVLAKTYQNLAYFYFVLFFHY